MLPVHLLVSSLFLVWSGDVLPAAAAWWWWCVQQRIVASLQWLTFLSEAAENRRLRWRILVCSVPLRVCGQNHITKSFTSACISVQRLQTNCRARREQTQEELTVKGVEAGRGVIAGVILLIVCIYWRAVSTTNLAPQNPGVGRDF